MHLVFYGGLSCCTVVGRSWLSRVVGLGHGIVLQVGRQVALSYPALDLLEVVAGYFDPPGGGTPVLQYLFVVHDVAEPAWRASRELIQIDFGRVEVAALGSLVDR